MTHAYYTGCCCRVVATVTFQNWLKWNVYNITVYSWVLVTSSLHSLPWLFLWDKLIKFPDLSQSKPERTVRLKYILHTSLKEIITRAGFQVNVSQSLALKLAFASVSALQFIVQPGAEGATPDAFRACSRDIIDASQACRISAASSNSVPCPALLIIIVFMGSSDCIPLCVHEHVSTNGVFVCTHLPYICNDNLEWC